VVDVDELRLMEMQRQGVEAQMHLLDK